jgi:hypothetical protein
MAPGKKSETPVYTGRTQISRLKGWPLSDKRRGQVAQMHENFEKYIMCIMYMFFCRIYFRWLSDVQFQYVYDYEK